MGEFNFEEVAKKIGGVEKKPTNKNILRAFSRNLVLQNLTIIAEMSLIYAMTKTKILSWEILFGGGFLALVLLFYVLTKKLLKFVA